MALTFILTTVRSLTQISRQLHPSKHLHFRSLKLSESQGTSAIGKAWGNWRQGKKGWNYPEVLKVDLIWHFRGAVEFGQWKHLWLFSLTFQRDKEIVSRDRQRLGPGLLVGLGSQLLLPSLATPNSISILWSSPQNPNLSHNPIIPPSHPKCPEAYMWIVITIMVNVIEVPDICPSVEVGLYSVQSGSCCFEK